MHLLTNAEHDGEGGLVTRSPRQATNPDGDGVIWAEEWFSPKPLANANDFLGATEETSCEDGQTGPGRQEPYQGHELPDQAGVAPFECLNFLP